MNYEHIKSWADLKRSLKPEPEYPFWKKTLGGICIMLGLWAFSALVFCLQ